MDQFFNRDFLIKCSWAGGSRDEDRKIAFKSYKNIINAFFSIIHLADSNFSVTDCENFFKVVIKNARRRANIDVSKNKRMSTFKNRPNNLQYKKVIKVDSEDDSSKTILQIKDHQVSDEESHVESEEHF